MQLCYNCFLHRDRYAFSVYNSSSGTFPPKPLNYSPQHSIPPTNVPVPHAPPRGLHGRPTAARRRHNDGICKCARHLSDARETRVRMHGSCARRCGHFQLGHLQRLFHRLLHRPQRRCFRVAASAATATATAATARSPLAARGTTAPPPHATERVRAAAAAARATRGSAVRAADMSPLLLLPHAVQHMHARLVVLDPQQKLGLKVPTERSIGGREINIDNMCRRRER